MLPAERLDIDKKTWKSMIQIMNDDDVDSLRCWLNKPQVTTSNDPLMIDLILEAMYLFATRCLFYLYTKTSTKLFQDMMNIPEFYGKRKYGDLILEKFSEFVTAHGGSKNSKIRKMQSEYQLAIEAVFQHTYPLTLPLSENVFQMLKRSKSVHVRTLLSLYCIQYGMPKGG